MDEEKIELTGVPANYTDEVLKLLFENKRRLGREISFRDVLFNRNRKAALVTLSKRGKAPYQTFVANFKLNNLMPKIHMQNSARFTDTYIYIF